MAKPKTTDTADQPLSLLGLTAKTITFFLSHAKNPREFTDAVHGANFLEVAQEFHDTNKALITKIEADGVDINAPEPSETETKEAKA